MRFLDTIRTQDSRRRFTRPTSARCRLPVLAPTPLQARVTVSSELQQSLRSNGITLAMSCPIIPAHQQSHVPMYRHSNLYLSFIKYTWNTGSSRNACIVLRPHPCSWPDRSYGRNRRCARAAATALPPAGIALGPGSEHALLPGLARPLPVPLSHPHPAARDSPIRPFP